MFSEAIETVGDYTRPVLFIHRNYGETVVIPGSGTMFFVNDQGCAVTCKHIAMNIIASAKINEKYAGFKEAKRKLVGNKNRAGMLKKLEADYGYGKGVTVNMKCHFKGCVSPVKEITCKMHSEYDLAIVQFKNFENIHYDGHAIFSKNADSVKPGTFLCRVGFPFPEFNNAVYNGLTDDIEWSDTSAINTPRFPLDGMVTRHVGRDGKIIGIEMSTPGLKGQSGGPLFDPDGIVYGMQFETRHLNLGFSFDEKGMPIRDGNTARGSSAFLHLGHCISAEVIKKFLDESGVEYFTER